MDWVKDEDGYTILLEANMPEEKIGPYWFSFLFAKSKDLQHWNYLDEEGCYPLDRYAGGPKMLYFNGYYYIISVTKLPGERFTNYISRTKDFKVYEMGKYNPFLMPDEDDRKIAPYAADITEEMIDEIKHGYNCNNSDVDMCEFNGKTIIDYATGNQLGYYYMAEAEYDGTICDLMENFFK